MAGTSVYIDPAGLNMEHTDAPGIRIRRIAREYRLSSAPTIDGAPTMSGSVVALKIVNGVGSLPDLPTVPLRFSGYDWKVRTTDAARGGLNNLYDADNAWTDKLGALHLRISKKPKGWTCAQVLLARSLGYGTYNFVVRDTCASPKLCASAESTTSRRTCAARSSL